VNIRTFLSNLREGSKNLSRGNKDTIKVCPVCLSHKIGPESSWVGGWLTPARFHCQKCNYRGYVYLETDPESLRTVLEEKAKEKQDVLEEQQQKVEDWDKGSYPNHKKD